MKSPDRTGASFICAELINRSYLVFSNLIKCSSSGSVIDNIYGFVFNAEKLLNPDTYSSEYAAFIYEMKNLEKLGCSTLRTISYTGSVLKIIFTIQLGGFNIVTDKVEEWLNFTRKSNTLSVLAKKEFESKFENDLKAYNEATIKEFVEIYG